MHELLVIDDEPAIGRLIGEIFRAEGFEILVARDDRYFRLAQYTITLPPLRARDFSG